MPNSASPATKPRVCIVSGEFNKLFRNGGIGTACTGLAQYLSQTGLDVTVLYTGWQGEGQDAATFFRQCKEFYAREFGIRVVSLPDSPEVGRFEHSFPARSLTVFHYLRDSEWDVIFFNDVNAEGFYSIMAKSAGLAFVDTPLCVVTHGPRTWVRELNRWPLLDANELEGVFMERACVQNADFLVSPSQYMLEWLEGDGWDLPESARVVKCRLPQWRRAGARGSDGCARLVFELLCGDGEAGARVALALIP